MFSGADVSKQAFKSKVLADVLIAAPLKTTIKFIAVLHERSKWTIPVFIAGVG